MPDLQDHPPDGRRIVVLHHLLHSAKPQTADGRPNVLRTADEADHPLDFESSRFLSRRSHVRSRGGSRPSSSTVFELSSATLATSFRRSSASKVALITLCGFDVPMGFVSTLDIPATSTTARTGPPAIIPVPSGAGFSST